MKRLSVFVFAVLSFSLLSFAQGQKLIFSFDQLFPISKQRKMGLQKLTVKEKEALRSHVEMLLITAVTGISKGLSGKPYVSVDGGHWIQKNIDNGTYIILEDGSLWEIDPLDRIDTSLWLPISEITVIESSSGSSGYDYLLINTDDGEKAHAKYMGNK